jgi:hypothetical protein
MSENIEPEQKDEPQEVFNFYKPLAHVAEKISLYNYKKIFLYTFLYSFWIIVGIFFSIHLSSSWNNHTIQSQKKEIEQKKIIIQTLSHNQNIQQQKFEALSLKNEKIGVFGFSC